MTSMKQDELTTLDITKPAYVEVLVSANGVLWVNVEGICRLRACRIEQLDVRDERLANDK